MIGTSVSLISTGVFLRKLELAPEPSAPSPPDQPPAPPVIGSIEAMMVRPLRLSVVLTFMMALLPAGPAGKQVGHRRLEGADRDALQAPAGHAAHADGGGELRVEDRCLRG